MTGDAVWCNAYPIILSSASVLPICAPKHNEMLSMRGSVNLSIGSFRYGVRAVRHRPGSADILVSTLYLSAHSETVYRSGGLNASNSSGNQSTFSLTFSRGFDFRRVLAFARVAFEVFFDKAIHHLFYTSTFLGIRELTSNTLT